MICACVNWRLRQALAMAAAWPKLVGVSSFTAARDRCGRRRLPPEQENARVPGWRQALAAGSEILEKRERAIDAVEAAVRVLEEDSCFNAGRGSVMTATGSIELDAAIMDGRRGPRARCRACARRALRSALPGACSTRARTSSFPAMAPTICARPRHRAGENSWFEIPERRRQLDELLAKAGSTMRSNTARSGP